MLILPLLNAAQTPDCARAKTISRAATISIIFDLFLRNGNTMVEGPLGSCVSYSSCKQNHQTYYTECRENGNT